MGFFVFPSKTEEVTHMNWRRLARDVGFWCCASGLITSVCFAESASQTLHAWTSRDSVSVRYYVSNQELPSFWSSPNNSDQTVVPSQDGRHFFVISHHGDLDSDSNVYDLNVYETRSVRAWLAGRGGDRRQLEPFRALSRRSYSSTKAAIRLATWDQHTPAIFFVSLSPEGKDQINRLDIASGDLKELAVGPENIQMLAGGSGTAVYVDSIVPLPAPPPYPALLPQRRNGGAILTLGSLLGGRKELSVVLDAKKPQPVPGSYSDIWISPDGRKAVMLSAEEKQKHFRAIDLARTPSKEEFNVPVASAVPLAPKYAALWSADSGSVILVNVLPEENATNSASVSEYDFVAHRWSVLESIVSELDRRSSDRLRYVSEVVWRKRGVELVVRHAREGKDPSWAGDTRYVRHRGRWEAHRASSRVLAPSSELDGISVRIRQSANDPPTVVASDGRQERALSTPDPALESVRFARSEPIEWHTTNGKQEKGGLTLPPGYVKGTRVPLVIQAYYYYPQFFLPDGPHASSDSAQALAARGMAVLQIDMAYAQDARPTAHPDREGEIFLDRVEAATAELDRLGIVDLNRVGLNGFSRAGYQTYYAITHPRKLRVAASVCDDSTQGSYAEYLIGAAIAGRATDFYDWDIRYGTSFWKGRAEWLREETSFNVDKVQGPVLFVARGGPPYSDFSLQTIGAFRMVGKPIEYLYIPTAAHNVLRPRERQALMDTVVEWLSFWLQDREEAPSGMEELYTRWRLLRKELSLSSGSNQSAAIP